MAKAIIISKHGGPEVLLDQVKEAHADLENRMISGPSIIIPN